MHYHEELNTALAMLCGALCALFTVLIPLALLWLSQREPRDKEELAGTFEKSAAKHWK